MKYIYIAGPYTGKTHDYRSYFEIHRHIIDALEMSREVARLGYGFFCPHQHSAHFEVIAPGIKPDYWYELDLHFMLACDAVLLLHGWRKSKGTREEVRVAHLHGIPVYKSINELLAKMPVD